MLRLTPLRETTSVQEVLQEHSIEMLMKQIQIKLQPSAEVRETIEANLEKLPLPSLEDLFDHILALDTLEQLQQWIDSYLPEG